LPLRPHLTTDAACIAFLQWALPRLGLAWAGLRRHRRQVCRRIEGRMRELGLDHPDAYRGHLESHAAEWSALAALCTVTVSRFHRDRAVFEALGSTVLPALAQDAAARGAGRLECWSAGCASGEEPYTLAILWKSALAARFPRLELRVLATDIDVELLARAGTGCYKASSLREVPAAWLGQAFERRGDLYCVRAEFREGVELERQDLAADVPRRGLDLVLCRNLAFTYFAPERAARTLDRIAARLRPGGALVVGLHEKLPGAAAGFEPWPGCRSIFRRC